MKIYFPLAKIDAESHEVWGYASTEARDDQGEVVKRDALMSALGDYMKFANIREMHQLSAVGIAKEVAVDDRGLYVGAKIIDPIAWQKVIEGVYKGYSIGGRVTQRDPADHKTITGLVLNEISLVDRPANPEAIFDYWKSAGAASMPEVQLNAPFQIWACGVPGHRHFVKSDAVRCQEKRSNEDLIATFKNPGPTAQGGSAKADPEVGNGSAHSEGEYADPGYQSDGQKRYPIDTEQHIRAAWNFINRPSNSKRYTPAQLDNIKGRITAAWKRTIDKDGPPSLDGKKKTVRFLSSQLSLTKALEDVGNLSQLLLGLTWLQENLPAEAETKAENSTEPSKLQAIIDELCSYLSALVAEETSEILDGAELAGGPSLGEAADIIIMAAGSHGANLIADLCQGRHRRLQQLAASLLMKSQHTNAGRRCNRATSAVEGETDKTRFEPEHTASGDLAKVLVGEHAEKAALIATLADIVPRLDQLTKRVEDIAHMPLPPVTMAKNVAAITKRQDTGGSAFSTDEIAAVFSQMSKEEQTLTLIKASYARPIHPPGLIRAQETVGE